MVGLKGQPESSRAAMQISGPGNLSASASMIARIAIEPQNQVPKLKQRYSDVITSQPVSGKMLYKLGLLGLSDG